MAKSSAQTVFVRGIEVSPSKFGSTLTTLGKVDDNLTLTANAASVQAVVHGNLNWLDALFNNQGMRKQNGDLTKRGAEVRDYIKAFAPINFNLDKGELTIKLTKNKKNKGMFYTLEKDAEGAPVKVVAAENPDFPLTLAEWRDFQAPNEDNGPKTKKALTLATQLESMAKLVAGEKEDTEVVGSAEEFASLYQQAMAVAQAALSATQKAKGKLDDINLTMAEQAASVTSGKEKRADTDRETEQPQLALA